MINLGLIVLVLIAVGGLTWLYTASCAAQEVDWQHGRVNVLDGFLRIYCRRFHRLDYEPLALPEQGPVLVVANHISGLDPLLLLTACRRPLRFLIADEEYRRFGLRWLFEAIGGIPVDRTGRPERALRHAVEALNKGEAVAIFPHGAIQHAGVPPKKLKGGAVRLAQMTGAPIYPVRISGVSRQGHTVSPFFSRSHARLQRFDPISAEDRSEKELLDELTRLLNKGTSD